jgi:hypothetical protein
MTKPFYCISYYEGDLSWIEKLPQDQYIVYAKSDVSNSTITNIQKRPNVGYNIDSYLTFIIDHYDNLPEITIFCKNNVVGRHVSKEVFEKCCQSKIFAPIEDPSSWDKLSFPVSVISNDGGYLELNNSWYTKKHTPKYFSNYNHFYKYIFDTQVIPTYLRFAPGANYVVPKENILIRSKNFYINLREFISHDSLACEAHYVERTLVAIWNSHMVESKAMQKILDTEELKAIERACSLNMRRCAIWIYSVQSLAFKCLARISFLLFGPR